MTDFLHIGKVIVNFDKIVTVELKSNWSFMDEKYISHSVKVLIADTGTSTVKFETEEEAIKLFEDISKKLNAVKV